jgi:hypothetical protein
LREKKNSNIPRYNKHKYDAEAKLGALSDRDVTNHNQRFLWDRRALSMNIPHSQELRLECIKDVVGTMANDREHAANPIKVIYWSAVT